LFAVTDGFGWILIERALCPLCALLSVTLSVKLLPLPVGVPLITAVPAFRLRPAGSAPIATDQV